MNEKTAKLLRKYAEAKPDTNLNDLKRSWNEMDQFERRDARVRMQAEIDAAPPAAPSAPPAEDVAEEA